MMVEAYTALEEEAARTLEGMARSFLEHPVWRRWLLEQMGGVRKWHCYAPGRTIRCEWTSVRGAAWHHDCGFVVVVPEKETPTDSDDVDPPGYPLGDE